MATSNNERLVAQRLARRTLSDGVPMESARTASIIVRSLATVRGVGLHVKWMGTDNTQQEEHA